MIKTPKHLLMPALLSAMLASACGIASAQNSTAAQGSSATAAASSGGAGDTTRDLPGSPRPYNMDLDNAVKNSASKDATDGGLKPAPGVADAGSGTTSITGTTGASSDSATTSGGTTGSSSSSSSGSGTDIGADLPDKPVPKDMYLGSDKKDSTSGSASTSGSSDAGATGSTSSGSDSGSTMSSGSADTTSGASGTSTSGASGTVSVPVTLPVTVPVTVLVPVEMRDDPKLYNGCWVRLTAKNGAAMTSGDSGSSTSGGTGSSASADTSSTSGSASSDTSGASASSSSASGGKTAANELTIAGQLNLASLTVPSGVDWSGKTESLVVGPNATVTVYGEQQFKGNAATLKSGQKIADVRKELGFMKSIDSLKVSCKS